VAWILALIISSSTLQPVWAQGADQCGELKNAYGPFDYTDPRNIYPQPGKSEAPLNIVEKGHFTPEVEALLHGSTTVDPLPDIEYTLRAFPNHHRALNAVANYHLQQGPHQRGRYSVDCWFDRAIRFTPGDGNVRLIYGIYLAKKGNRNKALEQYKKALELMPDSAEAHYNIALLYTEMADYERANEHAVRAYALGFPLPWLRNKLQELKVWNPAVSSQIKNPGTDHQ